jgi:hypothetical protein
MASEGFFELFAANYRFNRENAATEKIVLKNKRNLPVGYMPDFQRFTQQLLLSLRD